MGGNNEPSPGSIKCVRPVDKGIADCKQPRTTIFEECKRSELIDLFYSNGMMHRTIAVWRYKHKGKKFDMTITCRLPLLRHQDDWLPSNVCGCPLHLPKAPILLESALWMERGSVVE